MMLVNFDGGEKALYNLYSLNTPLSMKEKCRKIQVALASYSLADIGSINYDVSKL